MEVNSVSFVLTCIPMLLVCKKFISATNSLKFFWFPNHFLPTEINNNAEQNSEGNHEQKEPYTVPNMFLNMRT